MAIIRRRPRDNAVVERTRIAGVNSPDELRALARSKGMATSPLDVERLALALGFKIKREPMDDALSGYLQQEGGVWVIGVNAFHHPKRQRFTIAHELGHFFLHASKQATFVDRTLFRNEDSNPMEWEANGFAGELLMPSGEFKAQIARGVKKVEDLANHFNVSAVAVRVRAKILGFQGHGL